MSGYMVGLLEKDDACYKTYKPCKLASFPCMCACTKVCVYVCIYIP